MSRKTQKSKDGRYIIASGFDDACAFDAEGKNGYFVQVYDKQAISETNDEGIIVNIGFCPGVSYEEAKKVFNESYEKYFV